MPKKFVLIVEDNENNADLFNRALADQYRTQIIADGAEALVYIAMRAHEIDLVLLDIMLPSVSGDEIAEHLIAADIPYIVTSAAMDADLISRTLASDHERGARGFIPKPIDRKYVKELVRSALDGHRRDLSKVVAYYQAQLQSKIGVGILMERHALSEIDVERALSARASTRRVSKREIAEEILAAHNALSIEHKRRG